MTWSRRIAIIAAVIASLGLIDSGYLTVKHLQGSYIRCGDECSAVLGSTYADGVGGIPLAAFGATAYIAVLVATVSAALGSSLGRRFFTVMAPIMALFSLWLVYLQAFVIHAFCKYCLASAGACFILAALVLVDHLGRRFSGPPD